MGEGAPDRAGGYEPIARAPGASRRSRSTSSCASFADYERAKARAGRIDFDDLLVETIALLEDDAEAADDRPRPEALVQRRRVPGHEPAPAAAARAVARRPPDLCVVGDEDQTIYTFTGATSDFLTGFAERHPGARIIALTRNYRSTPQILELANRLIAADGRSKRLAATAADGPEPDVDAARRRRRGARRAGRRRSAAWLRATGIAPAEIAVLVRMNAQLAPIEAALTRAGIAYQVRGIRFYDRPEVKAAIASLRRLGLDATGRRARDARSGPLGRTTSGFEEDGGTRPRGDEARERQASLETLLAIVTRSSAATRRRTRARSSRSSSGGPPTSATARRDGVNLLTYHRAKGLEWDAVFLPMLEDGTLPIRQAFDDDEALAEERRLLYVGITRARAPPRAVVGGAARDARPRGPPPAEPVPAGSSTALGRVRPRASGPRPRRPARRRARARRPATTPTRCSRPSGSGGRRRPGTRGCPPT